MSCQLNSSSYDQARSYLQLESTDPLHSLGNWRRNDDDDTPILAVTQAAPLQEGQSHDGHSVSPSMTDDATTDDRVLSLPAADDGQDLAIILSALGECTQGDTDDQSWIQRFDNTDSFAWDAYFNGS